MTEPPSPLTMLFSRHTKRWEFTFRLRGRSVRYVGRAEDLGSMDLRDDAAARSFGYGVIRNLMQTHTGLYFGWTMDITADNRAVVSIPFEAVETRH